MYVPERTVRVGSETYYIPGSEEIIDDMMNIMICQCVTDIERHHSFIRDALKSMQGV